MEISGSITFVNISRRSGHDTIRSMNAPVHPGLLASILEDYALDPLGYHGVCHWARVLENGLRLAPLTGADPHVVALFAVFHDSRRVNEHRDDGHGTRGGALAQRFADDGLIDISSDQLKCLVQACELHTGGRPPADITQLTCWDSDRLDLPRVGVRINPRYLCTEAARDSDMISLCHQRSVNRYQPEWFTEWLDAIDRLIDE